METSALASPQNGNGNGQAHGQTPAAHPSVEKLTLVEAAQVIERLERRAAHERELEALRIARDAVLVIVSEGFTTLGDRLRTDFLSVRGALPEPALEPEPVRGLPGGSTASCRAAFSPHR